MTAPPPVIAVHDGILVVRDDLLPGGTKVRVVPDLLVGATEWVYAGPAQGYAQVALAAACAEVGHRATLFLAARNEPAPLTRQALALGAKVVQVKAGRLNVLQARARTYAEMAGARYLELGLKLPGMRDALAEVARSLPLQDPPEQVWVTAGSGTLAQALAQAWPDADLHAVQVGKPPELPNGATLHVAPEAFADPAEHPPPFPSASSYDAKAWRFVRAYAEPGALFWNVGA